MVRTTAPVAKGRTGLAYPGVPSHALLHGTAYLCGLRQNASDRSNVALQNAGAAEDGNITLRLWVYSGNGPLFPQNLPDIVLVPGAFHQINGILASNGLSLTNGYVRIERTAGTAPYYAYAVINDQFNSDGSFVPPILESTLMSESRLTLPAIVEANGFTTEVVATNWSSTKKTLHCRYVADAVQGADSTASFTIELNPHEQLILPDFVQHLRDSFIAGIGPKGPAFAGKMSAWVADPGGLTGIAVAARTSVPGTTGRHGLFYTAVPDGMTSTRSAWVFGLQQNAETRSNLVLVNTGIPDGIADVFRVELFDGETGRQVAVLETTVETGRWKQLGSVLAQHAPGTTQGYARVTRIQGSPFTVSGGGPFIAYAILNDGGQPGERTGDSAYVASAPARAGSASVTYAWFSCYRSPWDY